MTQPNSTARGDMTTAHSGASINPQPNGTALKSPKINAGKWLRWAYENLSEHHYLLMLRAHRAGRASR